MIVSLLAMKYDRHSVRSRLEDNLIEERMLTDVLESESGLGILRQQLQLQEMGSDYSYLVLYVQE